MMRFSHLRTAAALVALLISSSCVAATEVLLVDSVKVERQSKVVSRLQTEAITAQRKATGNNSEKLNSAYAEALEMSLSELRSALIEVVAEKAKLRKADLVIEPEVAKRLGITGADMTDDIVAALDTRFANLRFVAP